jgi:predicted ATPase with chaperone activity
MRCGKPVRERLSTLILLFLHFPVKSNRLRVGTQPNYEDEILNFTDTIRMRKVIAVQAKKPNAPQFITCNADMRPAEVRQFCQLDETRRSLMRTGMNQMMLSAQAYHRVQGEIAR